MNDFPPDFFNSPPSQSPIVRPPEDHLKELLDDPNKLVELQRKIELEPHRANELMKEVLGFGSEAAREKMIAKRKKQPYYKIGFAKMIKKVLDEMMIDRIDRTFHMRDYIDKTESTLFGMISQGLTYLEDHMDKDNVYKEFSTQFVIRRSNVTGIDGWIKICLIDNDIVELVAHKELAISTVDDVERALKNFIDEGPMNTKRVLPTDEKNPCPELDIKPFTLNEKEIAYLHTLVDNVLPGILFASIHSTRITLLKKAPDKV